jgi:hypothetical protein
MLLENLLSPNEGVRQYSWGRHLVVVAACDDGWLLHLTGAASRVRQG